MPRRIDDESSVRHIHMDARSRMKIVERYTELLVSRSRGLARAYLPPLLWSKIHPMLAVGMAIMYIALSHMVCGSLKCIMTI
ncbi:uncharacterized protein EI90DRAFT_3077693 [Cantharellus anzutake]|uniref:uncharacterized protein n=1 Tax=Cantharellus anzutake TaxID=1750568 RepID=UPI001907362C|nr:uncharacterized protein EI90DRAFT_3101817 [Cantharellus anzutake]XP_038910908.1 uncharacterized protein EI90DRAFT_3077693 [Cantharellus anzutake]KAF8310244.1 hypothetical protein EI90DRAFT_3101817 [Cantharellus anzutake]KAF8322751.1 hypothetical protein EI90DRAFT_3077693 [Cantharellus anzutake]